MQSNDLIYQVTLKFKNIEFIAFAFAKLLPRLEQIFDRDDILIGMSETSLRVDPPPAGLSCLFWSESNKLICSGMSIILRYQKSIATRLGRK